MASGGFYGLKAAEDQKVSSPPSAGSADIPENPTSAALLNVTARYDEGWRHSKSSESKIR